MSNVSVSRSQGGNSLVIGAVTLTVSGSNVIITGLPTSDPAVVGALWSNSGVVTVSAG
jgi:hypothetical protein